VDILVAVDQAKAGHNESLNQLYTHFFDKIFKFIYFRVNHKESAEDLTEEVFIKAFQKIQSLKNSEYFSAWLYQIAKNQIIDYYRKNTETVNITEVEYLLEYEENLGAHLDRSQDAESLAKHLQKLPREQRLVLQMKFFEEIDNTSIAEILNKSEGAIRVIQHRALVKLKEIINAEES